MTRRFISATLIVAASAMLAAQAPARYDQAEEKTVKGTIKALASYPGPDGSFGVHFDLKTADGIVTVHVAPAMYIGMQNVAFSADDQVEIVGVRVRNDVTAAWWPRTIRRGTELVVLRADDGSPKWTPGIDGTDGCGVAHPPLQRGTEY
ncbi:MAG TPA: hypothetical protein VL309_11965 [Vicinamibacterales bacterium]|jgi:hypothetical protein|nr:hypothetical protein [Vicinamibacterales bacterium]